jgi:hypothetical protein
MSFQVLTGEVCQVTQLDTSLVTLPSQVNLVPSNGAVAGVSSGVVAMVRPKVPNVVPSLGATE